MQDNGACGDYGDWASGTGKTQVQDAFGTPGSTPTITSDGGAEVTALNVIGYALASGVQSGSSDVATPEPSTWLLLGTGLFSVVMLRRSRAIRLR